MRVGRGGEPGTHKRPAHNDDPLVDRVEQVSLGLAHVRGLPSLGKSAQPLDGSLCRHPALYGLLGRSQRRPKLLHPLQVDVVSHATTDMGERELAHLALDPGPIDRDRSAGSTEGGYDARDDAVVELGPADLGEDGRLPRFIREAGTWSPVSAWLGVELAVATVGERPVAPEASPANALQEARQQVDAPGLVRSPTARLALPDVLDPGPQLVGHRRVQSPRRGFPRLIGAAVTADPAVVERVYQETPDARGVEARLVGQLGGADRPEGIALEQADGRPDRRRIDLEDVRRL